ncbi:DUF1810 family protein [Altererythrobacter aerius]|uniref:DUF1810 family protein n=2 Tax=Tsuneonella aeria TaxID=1837929 RepID=A0A6I4TGG0_9SPHN|nr:DUF1810 family protein [Tsuneonella aeria]
MALAELRAGEKRSHWMWFVFPQIAGLGRSDLARFYTIESPSEARDYLDHPVLGARLLTCTDAMLTWAGRRSAETILGAIDAIKFRSSMTLFDTVSAGRAPFGAALTAFYGGQRDPETLRRL